MATFTLVYIIIISIVGGFFLWRLFLAIDSIKDELRDIRTHKYNRLSSTMDGIMATVNTSKRELSALIHNSENDIQTYVSSESDALKKMITEQFDNQTTKLIEDIQTNRQSLANLIFIVQNMQNQLNKGIADNSSKIGDLNNSLTHAISQSSSNIDTQLKSSVQRLSSEEQQREKNISTVIDAISKKLTNFNNLIEKQLKLLEESNGKNTKQLDSSISSLASSLKLHTEKITSSCTQVINSEKELHQQTQGSFDLLNGNLSKYLSQLKQFDTIYNNLQNLYFKILEEEEIIAKQGPSLTDMVSRHTQILEITSEMNNTSREIFEFMKLYLIQSTLDNFKN